jgi:hypothetical protein
MGIQRLNVQRLFHVHTIAWFLELLKYNMHSENMSVPISISVQNKIINGRNNKKLNKSKF